MLVLSKKKENFKLDVQSSLEYIKKALLFLVVSFTFIYLIMEVTFGLKFILNTIVAVIFAREAEILFLTHQRKMTRLKAKEHIVESKPEISALLLVLLLPVSTPLYVTLVGIFFATFIVRMAFGGFSFNIFNIAIAARVFIQVSWADILNTKGSNSLSDYLMSLFTTVNYEPMNNLLYNSMNFETLQTNGYFYVSLLASAITVGVFIYLTAKKVIKPFKTIIALAIFALMFITLGYTEFAFMFISSPVVLLVTIFALNEPATTPNTNYGYIVGAIVFVIMSMLMIFTKQNQFAVFFAVLILNMVVPLIDGKINENANKVKSIIVCLILIVGGWFILDVQKPVISSNEQAVVIDGGYYNE